MADYELFHSHSFPDAKSFQEPIPGITYFEAFVCQVEECDFQTRSEEVADRHPHGASVKRGLVHQLFATNMKLYRIRSIPKSNPLGMVEGGDTTSTASTPVLQDGEITSGTTIVDFLLQQQAHRLEALKNLSMEESTNPFLLKYRWNKEIANTSVETIRALVRLPDLSDPLSIIPFQVESHYEPIVTEMKKTELHTTILRWVNTTKEYVIISDVTVTDK